MSTNRVANQLRAKYPELRDRIPAGPEEYGFPFTLAKLEISKTEKVFGSDWKSPFESAEAAVLDIVRLEKLEH